MYCFFCWSPRLCASIAHMRVWLFVVVKPSLQAFRAETMVERFTARMRVCAGGRLSHLFAHRAMSHKYAKAGVQKSLV